MSYRKYSNQRHNGHASKKEADVAQKLAILAGAGKIQDLKEQVPIEIIPKFEFQGVKYRALRYVADFVFTENGNRVVMDAKGCRTQVFKIKKLLCAALLKVHIEEV